MQPFRYFLWRVTALLVFIIALSASAEAQTFGDDRPLKSLGVQTISPATSTALTVPTGTQHILFRVSDADVNVAMDGNVATSSNFAFEQGTWYLRNQPRMIPRLRFICSGCSVQVQYLAWER